MNIIEQIIWTPTKAKLPDDETLVLINTPKLNEPVWLGYYESGCWYLADGTVLFDDVVIAWADLPGGIENSSVVGQANESIRENMAFGHLSDTEMASIIGTPYRDVLDQQAAFSAARDRIIYLSEEVARLSERINELENATPKILNDYEISRYFHGPILTFGGALSFARAVEREVHKANKFKRVEQ